MAKWRFHLVFGQKWRKMWHTEAYYIIYGLTKSGIQHIFILMRIFPFYILENNKRKKKNDLKIAKFFSFNITNKKDQQIQVNNFFKKVDLTSVNILHYICNVHVKHKYQNIMYVGLMVLWDFYTNCKFCWIFIKSM